MKKNFYLLAFPPKTTIEEAAAMLLKENELGGRQASFIQLAKTKEIKELPYEMFAAMEEIKLSHILLRLYYAPLLLSTRRNIFKSLISNR